MSETYTVKSINGEPKEWSGQYGPMLTYKLDLENEVGMVEMGVELNRKPDSRAPQTGERYVGHIEEGKYCGKLKIDFEATKALGSSGSRESTAGTASGKNLDASIARQVALKVLSPTLNSTEKLLASQVAHVEEIEQFILKAASQATGTPPTEAGAEPPTSSASPSPGVQDKGQEHQWFKRLLEGAHMDAEPAHVLADFIVQKFDKDQKARAEEGLENTELQPDTLAKLVVSYEKLEKKSLPSGSDDDIPF